jgi:serine/threonine protein kinase
VQSRAATLPPGTRIGERYVLSRVLGIGAMGAVYEAMSPSGARFALKTIFAPRDDDGGTERRARFLREAAVCATIDHPHVVPVVDHGIDATTDVPFLVMPLLVGEDLASVLDRVGCLEPEIAIALVVQACAGLAAVHARGVVHRDVKPSNLFLENAWADGPTSPPAVVVKVTDFGLAKACNYGDGGVENAAANARAGALTATGRFMGTPQYVSPEQAVNAKHVDVRSDVFSLGMSLYHALAGAPAFAYARTFMGLVLEVTGREAPPLQEAAPWVDPRIARIVHGALLRDPDARCPSVSELALALDMAIGIDASRTAVYRGALRAPQDERKRVFALRAEPVFAWADLLRC